MRRSIFMTPLQKRLAFIFAFAFAALWSSSKAVAQIGCVRSDGINAVVYAGNDGHTYEL